MAKLFVDQYTAAIMPRMSAWLGCAGIGASLRSPERLALR